MANNSILAAFERMWQHIVFILNEKSDIHPHPYAGSATEGGSATSAVKLDSSAGSVTQPVYFEGGKPKATTYALEKSVPADAKFTDTNNQVTQSPKDTDGEYPILLRGINPATTQCTAGTSFAADVTINPATGTITADSFIGDGGDIQTQINALSSEVANKAPAYTYGTTDLTAGTSALTTGTLYFVYE